MWTEYVDRMNGVHVGETELEKLTRLVDELDEIYKN